MYKEFMTQTQMFSIIYNCQNRIYFDAQIGDLVGRMFVTSIMYPHHCFRSLTVVAHRLAANISRWFIADGGLASPLLSDLNTASCFWRDLTTFQDLSGLLFSFPDGYDYPISSGLCRCMGGMYSIRRQDNDGCGCCYRRVLTAVLSSFTAQDGLLYTSVLK
jgi:hypothetical protein